MTRFTIEKWVLRGGGGHLLRCVTHTHTQTYTIKMLLLTGKQGTIWRIWGLLYFGLF